MVCGTVGHGVECDFNKRSVITHIKSGISWRLSPEDARPTDRRNQRLPGLMEFERTVRLLKSFEITTAGPYSAGEK